MSPEFDVDAWADGQEALIESLVLDCFMCGEPFEGFYEDTDPDDIRKGIRLNDPLSWPAHTHEEYSDVMWDLIGKMWLKNQGLHGEVDSLKGERNSFETRWETIDLMLSQAQLENRGLKARVAELEVLLKGARTGKGGCPDCGEPVDIFNQCSTPRCWAERRDD